MHRRKQKYADVVIIGGGIVGCSIAYELAKYKLVTNLVEQEPDLSFGASGANTGLVHAGFNPLPGSMKAKFSQEGNDLYPNLSKVLNVPFKRIGALVLASSKAEHNALDELMSRGKSNQIKGLKLLNRRQVLKIEPMLGKNISRALFAPTAGIISPYEFVIALAENAAMNGVIFNLSTQVQDIELKNNRVEAVVTNKDKIFTHAVINAAGIYSDTVAGMVGLKTFNIHPRRGEYLVLDSRTDITINHTLFPVPGKVSKGIVVTPTIDGNILLGPTADDVEDKSATPTTRKGQAEVLAGAQKLIPTISQKYVISAFSGMRAVADSSDFIIGYTPVEGFINAAGIASPGLTAAPAISKYVCTLLREIMPSDKFKLKVNYHPGRPALFTLKSSTLKEQDEYIKQNPAFGHMICRCEHVSEGEVVAAIHRHPSPTTLKGIKYRTRTCMGRCQGAFCTPNLIELLAREHGIEEEQVTLAGEGSELLFKTKKGIKK